MRSGLRWSWAVAPLTLLLAAGSAGAFEIENLVGKNHDKAHKRLGDKGYQMVRTDTGQKDATELWWNAGTKTCAQITVKLKGKVHRVKDATKVNKKKCKKEL